MLCVFRVMLLIKSSRILRRTFSSAPPTIFALSSGQGKCGVAVIRISGPKASDAILKMTKCVELPKPRMASLHYIRDPVTMEELDKGLVLWFPGPKSFTGEDSCEFQIHGGPAVIASVLAGLSKIHGFRSAEAGDFTKRAFFAGKLDLTEVEGLADLIHAETELQRKQALYQMEGTLGVLYKNWSDILKKNLAHVEAYIDFGEEDNIEEDVLKLANEDLRNLKKQMENHLRDGRRGERLRNGIKTTIVGEPNAGKSSLFNAIYSNYVDISSSNSLNQAAAKLFLSLYHYSDYSSKQNEKETGQRPAAIVTPIPGTTRDIIEIHLNINGFPIILADTAGLRNDISDIVEKEGIARAHNSIQNSDLVLLVIDSTKVFHSSSMVLQDKVVYFIQNHLKTMNLKTDEIIHNYNGNLLPKFVFVLNKIDLLNDDQKKALQIICDENNSINYISCKTEENFTGFLTRVTKILQSLCANPSRENPSITQSRHRHNLKKSVEYLNEYFEYINKDTTISAQRLRLSLRHLGKIIGTVTTEEILDIIFKDFCIGK